MKKRRIAGAALLLGCVILGAAAVILYIGQDRTPPQITVEEAQITYTEGEAYTGLLAGVTAEDNRDGDLTDEVFVDRVIPTGEDTAAVYYGVIDSAKNVATASRTVTYIPSPDSADVRDEAGEEESDGTTDAAETAGATRDAAAQDPAAQAGEQPSQDAAETAGELTPAGERPALALTAPSATVAAGSAFNPMSVVQAMVDDKDNVDTLSQRVMVDGAYDTNVPGSYALTFYVGDSDGNTSDPVAFTLIVQ